MQNKLRYTILIFLSLQILQFSCIQKMILNSLNAFEDNVPLKFMTNGDKKIVFFPMHHIGTKPFYDDAKNKIDSLMQMGYIVYFENVRMLTKDSLQKDTIYRKARKVTGVDFSTAVLNKGYIDTINNTLLGKKTKYISEYKLVNQTRNMFPISDTARVKNIDANFAQLLEATENKFGKIILEKYDYEIKFGEKYKAKRNKKIYEYFVTGFRNTIISSSILNDKHDKIIIVYGAKHFDGILQNLQAEDKNYKQVEKL